MWALLSETGGKLGAHVRLRGGQKIQLEGEDDNCGALACFTDADGNFLGIDIVLAGDPAVLEGVDCTDQDGNNLYSNPLRKIRQEDGSCAVGGLPIAVTDFKCESTTGCKVSLGDNEKGETEAACVELCVTYTNPSCYPMNVQPSVSIESARLGQSPIVYRIRPKVNGEDGDYINVFSGGGGCCETNEAGSGQTSQNGEPLHTHDGPSHTHTMVGSDSASIYSGTVTPGPITIQPGEQIEYCISQDVIYEDDFDGTAAFDVGNIRLCLNVQSIVNAETIAALEGES
jgi:hypothetical protein